MTKLPTWFLSHGGGPWPWVPGLDEAHAGLRAALVRTSRQVAGSVRAVLVVTAHWEEQVFTVGSGARPGMIYDYGGFPPHTYQLRYDAPGMPDLAERVADLLEGEGLRARLDPDRGYDHGTFVPLAVMWPEADVPVVQMSLRTDLDPEAHLQAGRALAPLREEGILILGSGLSTHNLSLRGAAGRVPSKQFDGWLQEVVTGPPDRRDERLCNWHDAPSARASHPREDHLLPLMVVTGAAAGDPATCDYTEDDVLGGWTVSNFRFGDLPSPH
ncbi:MAG: class III extradiol ring-cleavage dioxygenase [Candidatus Sericytochromatia bacterium]|nr:class III extradiol ring-cleavage dioxygenase [Candidatus Sericytochromatia bacterium]